MSLTTLRRLIIVPAAPRTWAYEWDANELYVNAVLAWVIYEELGQDLPAHPVTVYGEATTDDWTALFDCSYEQAKEIATQRRESARVFAH